MARENLEILGIRFETSEAQRNALKLHSQLSKLHGQTERNARSMDRLQSIQRRAVGGALALTGGYLGLHTALRAVGAAARTITEFEQLDARLRTLAGGAREGAKAMAELTAFASETPFSLQQSVAAYARFRSVGLAPTIEQMRQLGNFAAAQGSNIEDAAAAVVQGAFAETERLKSLAIATQVSASEIRLGYDDITRSIQRTGDARRDAAQILEFVNDLGSARFGSAMAEQMETIAGSASNLKDAMSLLAVEIGRGGFADAWAKSNAGAAELTRQLTDQLRIAREVAEAERRTLALRSPNFQAQRDAVARSNEIERSLLRNLRASAEAEAKALDKIMGRETVAPPQPDSAEIVPVDDGQLVALRAAILEMTHGREVADQYRVSVAGAKAELLQQELALKRSAESLREHAEAGRVAARAEQTRQARIVAALRTQERYVVSLEEGRAAAARFDFLEHSPDAEAIARWDEYAKRIEAATAAGTDFAGSQNVLQAAMRRSAERARVLEANIAALLRVATSGRDIIEQLAGLLQGVLIEQVAGRIAGAIAPGAPASAAFNPATLSPPPADIFSGARPGLAAGREQAPTVVNLKQTLSVTAIDAQGVADFLEANAGAIGQTAVSAISQNSGLLEAIR